MWVGGCLRQEENGMMVIVGSDDGGNKQAKQERATRAVCVCV